MRILACMSLTILVAFSSNVFAGNLESARKMKVGILRAKAKIAAISNARHFTLDNEENENDEAALLALINAEKFLNAAADTADKAVEAYKVADVAEGNYQFVITCTKTSIARSSVSRANIAASNPPLGRMSAFGPEMLELVEEISTQRTDVNCP